MRKLLLICSAVSLIYGNCVWGIDYDENELYENPWSDSNLDPLKENFDKNDEKQVEETLSKNSASEQKLKELLNLEREKIKKYEKALQKSQQLLAEEREKNRQSGTQEQEVRAEEKLSDINQANPIKKEISNDKNSSNIFRFSTNNAENLFNIGSVQSGRRIAIPHSRKTVSNTNRNINNSVKNEDKFGFPKNKDNQDEIDTKNQITKSEKNQERSQSYPTMFSSVLKTENSKEREKRLGISYPAESLDLRRYKTFLEDYDSFPKLKEMTVNSKILNDIPLERLKELNFPRLTKLNVYGDDETQLDQEKISELLRKTKSLEYLDISHNELNVLPEEVCELVSLKTLRLTGNKLSTLPAEIQNLKNLQTLAVVNNKLVNIPKTIGYLRNLQILRLGKNQVSALPEEIGNLQNLQELDVRDNPLIEFPKKIKENLKQLKKLSIGTSVDRSNEQIESKDTHKDNNNSKKSNISVPKLEDAQRTFNTRNTSSTTQTTSVITQENNLNTIQNRLVSGKSTIDTMSVNGKNMPINMSAQEALKNDIEGRLFVMEKEKSNVDETQSIIDSLEIYLLDQDPVQKEKMIKDNIVRNRKGLLANDKGAWDAVAGVINKRICIYQFRNGGVDRFWEYGKEFSANGTRRIYFEDYATGVCYRTLREAISIDGKIIPIMFCSSDFLNTLQADIKGRLFKREDKGAGWKTYLNQCSMNSLELTNEENASIPTYIRENAHANGGLLADDAASWKVIANIIKRRILVYEQQQECIQGFYEYGKEFSRNGTKRVCLRGIHYQKLAENNQNINTTPITAVSRKIVSNMSQNKVSPIRDTVSSGVVIRKKTTPNRVNQLPVSQSSLQGEKTDNSTKIEGRHITWDEYIEAPFEGPVIFDDEELDVYPEELKYLSGVNAKFLNLKKLQINGYNQNGIPRITEHSDLGKGLSVLLSNSPNLTDLSILGCMSGYLPSEIWKLRNLNTLTIRGNQLTSLSSEIGNLKRLTKLWIAIEQLTSLPKEIGNLVNLTSLDVDNNHRLTSIPAEIGNLVNLKDLTIYANQLTGLPKEIGNLTNLISLNIGGNRLTNFPIKEIGSLTNLTSLSIDNNQLTSLPKEIGNLKKLTGLSIGNNRLTSIPAEIGNLTNLTLLVLHQNQLTSIPAEIGNLTNLQVLLIHNNRLTSLPKEIENLRRLNQLDVDIRLKKYVPEYLRDKVNRNIR